MTRQLQWEALPGRATCNSSQVMSLKLQPRVQEISVDPRRSGQVEILITERAADASAAVLKKCIDSLEKFHFQEYCPMRRHGQEVISLPKLQKISFTGGYIRPRNLRAWMAKTPTLEHSECMSTRSYGAGEGTWLDVFNAIRLHPRVMKIKLDEIFARENWISMEYHTDDLEGYLKKKALEGD